MRARRRLTMALAFGAAASVSLSGCGFKGLYTAPLPGGADLGDHPYTVTAYFSDVLDLVPQSAVKVNDIPVGKVVSISLDECTGTSGATSRTWCAKVKVQVNDDVNLPGNARAEIQQTSLLGEKYVALLDPTSNPNGKLGNGTTIPLSVTKSAPEAEDVLGALSLVLNKGGLDQIQVIAKELNNALDGKQRQAAIRDLLTQLNVFTGTLDDQKDKITTSLDNIDTLAITLRKQETLLKESLDTFPAALRVLSQERTKLVTLLTSLSRLGTVATRVINASQDDLVKALKAIDPVVQRLTAVGDNLPKALRIAGTFPFPLGVTRQIVKGDYANLDADITLNVGDVLCSLGNDTLCNLGKTLLSGLNGATSSVKSQKITMKVPASQTPPVLLGSGR